MTGVRRLPLTFMPSILAAILKNRSIHADTIRHFLSFYRGGRFGQFLYTVPEGSGVGGGELLDRRGFVLLADRSAAGGLADGAAFYGDHIAGGAGDIGMDFFLGVVVGCRGAFVWVGGAISGDVAGKFGVAGVHVCIRGARAFDLL